MFVSLKGDKADKWLVYIWSKYPDLKEEIQAALIKVDRTNMLFQHLGKVISFSELAEETQNELIQERISIGKIKADELHLFKPRWKLTRPMKVGLEWMVKEGRTQEVEALLPFLDKNLKYAHRHALKLLGKSEELARCLKVDAQICDKLDKLSID